MPLIDRDESPFYAWLDHPTIRSNLERQWETAAWEELRLEASS